LPLADCVVIRGAVGDHTQVLLQFYQDAQHVGGIVDVGIQQDAPWVHQFAYFHGAAPLPQSHRSVLLRISWYKYSPTAPSVQVQVVTVSALALTSAGALATATA